MKATKLLCGIAAMALAFAACNKVDQPANESENLKSIAVDFGNILSTKSVDTPAPSEAITVNNLQVFFTDGTNFYQAKDADGHDAVQHFSTNAVSSAKQVYHFLPAAVKDVIVVANLGEKPKTFANVAALEAEVVNASTQQYNSNVALYGRATATMSATQPDASNHTADYYEATVNLSTRVARIEVEGFEYAALDGKRVYQSIVVDKIAVANYGLTCPIGSGVVASSATANISTPTQIKTYLDGLTSGSWMVDAPAATLVAPSFAWTVPSDGEGDAAKAQVYSYSVIPTAVPNICVALRGKVDASADDNTATPLFLATSALKKEGTALTSLEAGKVYRLNFSFDDNALNTQGKCINVTVTVDSWVIVPVTPEF